MHKRKLLADVSKKGLLYISTTDINDDFKASLHSHPNMEILIITKGEGKIITNRKQIPIKEGNVIIINQNSSHYEFSESSCSFHALGVDNSNAFLKETFKKKIIYFPINKDDFSKMLNFFSLLSNEAENRCDSGVIDPCFEAIISIIVRNSSVVFRKEPSNYYSTVVATAKDIIDNYYFSNLTLEDIATRLSISPSRLAHLFKKEIGLTIIEYKLLSQISEAYNLLSMTDMPITNVSNAVGFNDSAYFTKQFKRCCSMTPKEYRKRFGIKKKEDNN